MTAPRNTSRTADLAIALRGDASDIGVKCGFAETGIGSAAAAMACMHAHMPMHALHMHPLARGSD
ncbi:MAG: hypothetical protein ACKOYN_01825 [Planctomycetota bacterium]